MSSACDDTVPHSSVKHLPSRDGASVERLYTVPHGSKNISRPEMALVSSACDDTVPHSTKTSADQIELAGAPTFILIIGVIRHVLGAENDCLPSGSGSIMSYVRQDLTGSDISTCRFILFFIRAPIGKRRACLL